MSEPIYAANASATDEMTAPEMLADMVRRGYEIKTSNNWCFGKFELRVSNGGAGCVYYIPVDEIDDERIKSCLEDSIAKIHEMKGDN